MILNLESMWEESTPRTPMVCFLSMGSDPTASIEALAKKMRLDCRAISMGQGQEVHARRLLQQFMAEGGWVLLQNCHLGLNFMDELLDTVSTSLVAGLPEESTTLHMQISELVYFFCFFICFCALQFSYKGWD